MTGASLVIVSSLTFLGIGVVPPDPTWGGLLAGGLQFLYQAPWSPVVPALLIVATVWALNAIADAVRDASSTSRRRPSPDKQDQNRQEKIADVV
jgi:peptide/nickel transport system permease protein